MGVTLPGGGDCPCFPALGPVPSCAPSRVVPGCIPAGPIPGVPGASSPHSNAPICSGPGAGSPHPQRPHPRCGCSMVPVLPAHSIPGVPAPGVPIPRVPGTDSPSPPRSVHLAASPAASRRPPQPGEAPKPVPPQPPLTCRCRCRCRCGPGSAAEREAAAGGHAPLRAAGTRTGNPPGTGAGGAVRCGAAGQGRVSIGDAKAGQAAKAALVPVTPKSGGDSASRPPAPEVCVTVQGAVPKRCPQEARGGTGTPCPLLLQHRCAELRAGEFGQCRPHKGSRQAADPGISGGEAAGRAGQCRPHPAHGRAAPSAPGISAAAVPPAPHSSRIPVPPALSRSAR